MSGVSDQRADSSIRKGEPSTLSVFGAATAVTLSLDAWRFLLYLARKRSLKYKRIDIRHLFGGKKDPGDLVASLLII